MGEDGASDGRGSGRDIKLVVPGEALGPAADRIVGHGVGRRGDQLIATRLGHLCEQGSEVSVVPVKTAYMPRPGDLVVGYIEGMRANIWFIDIGAPFNAILPMSLAPVKVDYGATRDAMDVGTTILCRVQEVDESHSSVVTMKGMGLRKLNSGFVDQVPPHLNAQIIGSKGSMIQMLKEASDCRIIVGQNGRLWIEGEPEGIRLVRDALKMIRETGHAPGLAGRVQGLLDS